VLILLATGKANVVTAGLLTSGFAASCIEVLLLVAFQTLYGYLYQMIGVIVTVFMGGLAVGALLRPKLVPSVSRRAYMMAQIGITAYALVLLLFLSELDRFSGASFLTLTLFMVLTFEIAALVGIVFSIAAELRAGDATAVASELYGVDLLGSALGALLVATILIPAAGFEGVCLIVGALTLLSGLLVTRKSGSTIVTG
jgi:spermidine synthase